MCRFVIGGPHGDAGLTGRKIIIDTYGGWGAHGGGAFSGKDPTKVDRSGESCICLHDSPVPSICQKLLLLFLSDQYRQQRSPRVSCLVILRTCCALHTWRLFPALTMCPYSLSLASAGQRTICIPMILTYLLAGAYIARQAAKSVVASGLAKRCLVQISYAIGVAQPLSVHVDTYGTGSKPDKVILAAVLKAFDFRPGKLLIRRCCCITS